MYQLPYSRKYWWGINLTDRQMNMRTTKLKSTNAEFISSPPYAGKEKWEVTIHACSIEDNHRDLYGTASLLFAKESPTYRKGGRRSLLWWYQTSPKDTDQAKVTTSTTTWWKKVHGHKTENYALKYHMVGNGRFSIFLCLFEDGILVEPQSGDAE